MKSPTPSVGHAPPPILRKRSMANLPPPSELVTLHGIVKYSPYILKQGMQTLQSYTERNTSFVVKKSVVILVFGECISSGMGILEACRVAGTSMGFSERVVWRWDQGDFFGILTSVEDATDGRLEMELESGW